MEPDRYQQNKLFYIVGLLCMVSSLMLFGAGIYVTPYIIFGWFSDVPHPIVIYYLDVIQGFYGVNLKTAKWILVGGLLLGSFVCAYIAYFTSNRIENEIHELELEEEGGVEVKKTAPKESKDTLQFIATILGVIIMVFFASRIFQWLISAN